MKNIVCLREMDEIHCDNAVGVSSGKKGNKSLNETDEEIGGGDESGEEGIERELDEDLDD